MVYWGSYKQHILVMKGYYGGTYSPHPLGGNPSFLHGPQRVHEPAAVARMLRWRPADVEQSGAVGPGCQTQHVHQTADRLVAYPEAVPGSQGLYGPVGVALGAEVRRESNTEIERTLFSSVDN